ncbi:MAG: phosphotransferase [Clostridiales bacterium]|jgi:fructosamine-3-kinase|nr:phosphotransferase [Clostridiales bacterium]
MSGNENYSECVTGAAASVFGGKISRIKYLGGGFYGRVFEVKLRCSDPSEVIVKLHLLNNMGQSECEEIKILKKYAKVKMPEIYAFVPKATSSGYDAIVMEKIRGKRLDKIKNLPQKYRAPLAEQIIDNMIAWHDVTNDTFGIVGGRQYATWREYLSAIIDDILLSLKALQKDNGEVELLYNEIKSIGAEVGTVVPDNVKAALIHGEYNTRNIFVDKGSVTGVIDPFQAGFADREFALHQLDTLNGRELGLLELYKSKIKLSENFDKKSAFYKLFLELRHHLSTFSLEEKDIVKIKKLIKEYSGI